MQFEFATAGRIVFGPGSLRSAIAALPAMGKRALVVTGSDTRRSAPLTLLLNELGVAWCTYPVPGEPSVETAQAGVACGRDFGADVIVGFGGGSALDAAKAIAALLANPGDPLDYLEVVGRGKPLKARPLPIVAIPTTAGTGSEVTKNAVLASAEHQVKVSLRDEGMLPRLAIVDSELTLGVPRAVTAATGLDALTQCIEPYLSRLANPLTDGVALQGVHAGAQSIERAYNDGSDLDARTGMALTSLCGGLALANAKLGAVHGFAGPIGGMVPAPHGAVCARLLPIVWRENLGALRARAPEHPSVARFATIAAALTGDPRARPEQGFDWLERLVRVLGVPGLASYGLGPQQLGDLVAKARCSSSMKGNPIELLESELYSIVEQALLNP